MLFLLGAKVHPVVKLILAAIAVTVGVVLHFDVLIASGGLMLVWLGAKAVRRLRGRGALGSGGLGSGGLGR